MEYFLNNSNLKCSYWVEEKSKQNFIRVGTGLRDDKVK